MSFGLLGFERLQARTECRCKVIYFRTGPKVLERFFFVIRFNLFGLSFVIRQLLCNLFDAWPIINDFEIVFLINCRLSATRSKHASCF